MHCPTCGSRIDNDGVSYCNRCGQPLDRVRALLTGQPIAPLSMEVSRAGLNFGVGSMFAGLWPALFAIISSPIAIPAAFMMLGVAYLAIFFGSVPLMRLFRGEEIPKEIESARRKEISFGAGLMSLFAIVSTLVVAAAVPDRWGPTVLVTLVTVGFFLLLASSKSIFNGFRSLTSSETAISGTVATDRLRTGPLGEIASGDHFVDEPHHAASAVEVTTRRLNESEAGR